METSILLNKAHDPIILQIHLRVKPTAGLSQLSLS